MLCVEREDAGYEKYRSTGNRNDDDVRDLEILTISLFCLYNWQFRFSVFLKNQVRLRINFFISVGFDTNGETRVKT